MLLLRVPSSIPSPFEAAARSQDAMSLAGKELQILSPLYREALLLRFQEDLSLAEIAQVLGAPVTTVTSRIYRGLAALRSAFEEVIRMEGDKRFRELIDRSFVEEISEGERQLIHDHIRDCDGCKRYVELTARTIRGLREFTFTGEPDSNTQVREILAHHTETMHQHNVQFKVWAAFAVALSMSVMQDRHLSTRWPSS